MLEEKDREKKIDVLGLCNVRWRIYEVKRWWFRHSVREEREPVEGRGGGDLFWEEVVRGRQSLCNRGRKCLVNCSYW